VPTLSLLHHRSMAIAATCSHCGEEEETLLHCFRDCRFSKNIWHEIGFSDAHFFSDQNAHNWLMLLLLALTVRVSFLLFGGFGDTVI